MLLLWAATSGCMTHEVAVCLPPCDTQDVALFSACVADGSRDCAAGNRRCCALQAGCLGPLDDQTVVTTLPNCEAFHEDECFPPCDSEDEADFDVCVEFGGSGEGGSCAPGDDECCALAVDCLGELGDLLIYSEGCCADSSECAADEMCDPELWECTAISTDSVCGDDVTSGAEECDDGNRNTEVCDYGAMSCAVCDADCFQVAGATSYCGDSMVDTAAGEECDAPGSRSCDDACRVVRPSLCSDGSLNGAETDIDCGGPECPPCETGEFCEMDRDCAASAALCEFMPFCGSDLVCESFFECDDGDVCTEDVCDGAVGCVHRTPAEICGDRIDQDCDRRIDEGCP